MHIRKLGQLIQLEIVEEEPASYGKTKPKRIFSFFPPVRNNHTFYIDENLYVENQNRDATGNEYRCSSTRVRSSLLYKLL